MVNRFMNFILIIVVAVTCAPFERYHNTNNGIHQDKPILKLVEGGTLKTHSIPTLVKCSLHL